MSNVAVMIFPETLDFWERKLYDSEHITFVHSLPSFLPSFLSLSLSFFLSLSLSFFLMAVPRHMEVPGRSQIEAAAASLHHGHSNTRSEPYL